MNRLGAETSPYLRQHRDNPVDWYPWGDEALTRARAEDRPILLSVGYSSCHWCHVMAHESFEDAATAAVMNELFVNVKVDREERPDVDAVYMEAVQALNGHGGWPMTVFLTPEGKPFYAGTYYPKTPRGGLPGFVTLLQALHEAWRDQRQEVVAQADRLVAAVRERSGALGAPPPGSQGVQGPNPGLLNGAYSSLRQLHDPEWGGFGAAPKFPQPSMVDLLFRAWRANRSDETLQMVTTTLDAMASGGIYDHLGGGFARYSTDGRWLVPHFEKMLYDQAGLARVYLHGWQVTGHRRWLQVLEETVEYVLRDLRLPQGGLCSAEDADSEGVEGKFYVWSRAEVLEALAPLGPERAAEAARWYGVTEAGNFEGSNILNRPERGDLIRPPEVEQARGLLFEARAKRVRPGLDDKVLTEWNAMFLASLAEAAGATGRRDWLEAAVATATFLLDNLRRPDGRWLRSWQEGRARQPAFAADHAWLVEAFTRLGEASGEARWVAAAQEAADGLLRLFWDERGGGLFTTGSDGEELIVRSKDVYDGATPSANSVAAVALLRLGALTGQARYREAAERILAVLDRMLAQSPTAVTYALAATDLVVGGITEVAVVGERPDLVDAVRARFQPDAVLAWGEPYPSPLWEARRPGFAYVCRNYACQAPVDDVGGLVAQLG
ncbi:MAG: thioredoxin domain-containing protein [Actinobacteria bacterium]|nr:MAG: thioredoxin domain-containing protein [Actinomycetota bacterium]